MDTLAIPIIQDSDEAIVFFDLKMGGFRRNDDILQIAMKCDNAVFNKYVMPTRDICPEATSVHGLTNYESDLYLHGVKVKASPLRSVLTQLLWFLKNIGDPCVLVSHNCGFNSSRLFININHFSLTDEFQQVVVGFTDSLSLFKKLFPDKNGRGSFKLTRLAVDLMNLSSEGVHDAMYNVDILQKLAHKFISDDDLVQNARSLLLLLESLQRRAESIFYLQTLSPLVNVVSRPILERLAYAGISYHSILHQYKKSDQQMIDMLQQTVAGKVQVIRNKSVLNDILRHFRKKFNHA